MADKSIKDAAKELEDKKAGQKEADVGYALEQKRQELEKVKSDIDAQRREIKTELQIIDSARDIRAAVLDAVKPVSPIELKTIEDEAEKAHHEWVLACSDWHIGQTTTLEETGGLFETSTDTVLHQIQTLWNALKSIHATESHGIVIDILHLLSLGDMVDGDLMRVSQTRKIDRVVAQQYPIVFALWTALIDKALTIIKRVEVDVVGGNHDRFGKFGDAGLGELAYIDNWSYVLGEALRVHYANEPRVKIINHESYFGTKVVAGHKFVFSHGSDVNWSGGSYAGLPYFGLNVAGTRMKDMVDGYNVFVMGHGHVGMELPVGYDSRIVMNGALPATSTYVQSKYKSIRRPKQMLISMHKRLGYLGAQPIYLDHEGIRTATEMWENEPQLASRLDFTLED